LKQSKILAREVKFLSLQKDKGVNDKMKYEFMQEIGIVPNKVKRITKMGEKFNKDNVSQK
jgi:hypothetical protein